MPLEEAANTNQGQDVLDQILPLVKGPSATRRGEHLTYRGRSNSL